MVPTLKNTGNRDRRKEEIAWDHINELQDQGLAKAPLKPHYSTVRSSWETAIHLQGTLAYALSPCQK